MKQILNYITNHPYMTAIAAFILFFNIVSVLQTIMVNIIITLCISVKTIYIIKQDDDEKCCDNSILSQWILYSVLITLDPMFTYLSSCASITFLYNITKMALLLWFSNNKNSEHIVTKISASCCYDYADYVYNKISTAKEYVSGCDFSIKSFIKNMVKESVKEEIQEHNSTS